MGSHLEQLDSTEGIALMYLAGELSAKDGAAVEQRIAIDPAFAAEVERTRNANEYYTLAFADADRARRLPVKQDVAVRRVSRAMHEWLVDRAAATTIAPPPRRLRIPVWAYPVGVAASVIVAFLIWSTNQKVNSLPPDGNAVARQQAEEETITDQLASEFDPRSQIRTDQQWQALSMSTTTMDDAGALFGNPLDERSQ